MATAKPWSPRVSSNDWYSWSLMPKGRRHLFRLVPKGPPPELVPLLPARKFEAAPLNEFVESPAKELVDGIVEFVERLTGTPSGPSRRGGGNGRSPGAGGRSPGGLG